MTEEDDREDLLQEIAQAKVEQDAALRLRNEAMDRVVELAEAIVWDGCPKIRFHRVYELAQRIVEKKQ